MSAARCRPGLVVALALAAGACKGRDARPATGGAGSGAAATGSAGSSGAAGGGSAAGDSSAAAPADAWATCKAALATAATLPPNRRAAAILEGCQPCGDWAPLLRWDTPPAEGGPDRRAIEARLAACGAWCEPTAKIRFMGALDDARATGGRAPWRHLAEVCKDKVSAVPDHRFMSAPYFALDRIARDAGAREGGPALLAGIELPLPAVSATGVGFELPVSPLARPAEPPGHVTVSMSEVRTGKLPRAKLTPGGLVVTGADYPGERVDPRKLAAALRPLGEPATPFPLFAPQGMPARRLLEVIGGAAPFTLHLAVVSTGPTGWAMYGTVPVALGARPPPTGPRFRVDATGDAAVTAIKGTSGDALRGSPVTLELEPTATVASVAKVVGALAFFEVPAVALTLAR